MKEPMQTTDDVVVIEALRTPRGAAKETGALHQVTPMELMAGVLREPLWRFMLLVGVAKISRYAVLAALTLGWAGP